MYKYLNLRDIQSLTELPQFEGNESKFRGFAEYCRLRDQGLRPKAMESLHQFVTDASEWTLPERIAFVDTALTVSSNPSDRRIPRPIAEGLIIPTLEEWISESPQTSTPHRWLGLVTHDVRPLERALAMDPQDQIACEALIRFVIESIQYAVHELPSGYLGDYEADYEALRGAMAYAPALIEPMHRERYIAELRSLIEMVERYRAQYDEQSDGTG